jgi:hypothetical protein
MTLNQKLDFASGNKTAIQWNPQRVWISDLPLGTSGAANTLTTFNSDRFYLYPTGYPLFFERGLGREDSIHGYLRAVYQIMIKNGNIFDFNTWYGTGWTGDQDEFIQDATLINNDGYYNNPNKGVSPGNTYSFWRKALYHARKMKEEIIKEGLILSIREAYSWAAIHVSTAGRIGINAPVAWGSGYVTGSNKLINLTNNTNSLGQNWGEFWWPILGAMQSFENKMIPYSLVLDDQLKNGELNGIKVIVVPHREWLSLAQELRLVEFVSRGGKVVYMDEIFNVT